MKGVAALPASPVLREGVTYAQAMEVFERFFARNQAAPTVAQQMVIPYKTVCMVLDGKVWPAARQHWLDRVLP